MYRDYGDNEHAPRARLARRRTFPRHHHADDLRQAGGHRRRDVLRPLVRPPVADVGVDAAACRVRAQRGRARAHARRAPLQGDRRGGVAERRAPHRPPDVLRRRRRRATSASASASCSTARSCSTTPRRCATTRSASTSSRADRAPHRGYRRVAARRDRGPLPRLGARRCRVQDLRRPLRDRRRRRTPRCCTSPTPTAYSAAAVDIDPPHAALAPPPAAARRRHRLSRRDASPTPSTSGRRDLTPDRVAGVWHASSPNGPTWAELPTSSRSSATSSCLGG